MTRTHPYERGSVYTRPGRRRSTRIAGQFTVFPLDVMESPAWQVLSLSARRIIDRICIELRHHAGRESARIPVSYDDFESYGIHRHSIAPAIREAVALGFVCITREGRAGNAEFRQVTL